ncbi:GntR family transcriptional regulator [Pseudotabrizicola alkalilacus]|uniref:GntR family transcriptional regulator n=1 Tax=Pseudotabrizicola alkalilacus TaxID=2305252 RepID=A0A411YX21_9RHOB|nr:GntR family transcriptional regulator [Pseudotabrizicola alkalilacus]RGP35396.1 GntR family transcriptional regulator [Pseudotabrizicola alkalilacus]
MTASNKNATEQVSPYDYLLAAIESGELTPGTRLRETELAETLGISRTPVREALHRLHAMGLAQHGPQRGLIVAHLSYEQLRQLFAVRQGLEGMATRLAAEHASRHEISVLQEMVEDDRGVRDPKELSRRNKLFHKQIARASHNTYMIEALDSLRIHLSLLPSSTYHLAERIDSAQKEHEAIVAAIAAGDGDAAELNARNHIVSGYKIRLTRFSSGQGF